MLKLILISVVIIHMIVVFGNALAFFILPFTTPWYVALPLCSFIVWVSCHKQGRCPMTVFENKIRVELGMPEINGFIKHYIIKPVLRYKRK